MTDTTTTRGSARDQGALLEFLKGRRWFGDKGRRIEQASIVDVVPVEWPGADQAFEVARARIATDAGTSTYQLFLVAGASRPEEALEQKSFRRGLADAFRTGTAFDSQRGGTRWVVAREGRKGLVAPPTADVKLSSAEQSNSSMIIDAEAILKLFRRLEPGPHPDVEITRFLTIDRAFPHVPVLLGTIRFEDRDGTVTTAGMLQELVPGAKDGWAYALERSREYFHGASAGDPPFAREAEQLGVVTRAMHEALGSGEPGSDFDLRPAQRADVERWARSAATMAERALGALERAVTEKRLKSELTDDARAVVARRGALREWIAGIASAVERDCGGTTRTHGDYHLGQVLRSAAGQFLVIDFEGEPARPIRERREHHSPLRDVAGMLRSFAYAAAAGSRTAGGAAAQDDTAERATRWEQVTRDAFLAGYFAPPSNGAARAGAGLLPRSRENADTLIRLFEAEKIFYELLYEIDHRPDWVWIPLRGIAELRP